MMQCNRKQLVLISRLSIIKIERTSRIWISLGLWISNGLTSSSSQVLTFSLVNSTSYQHLLNRFRRKVMSIRFANTDYALAHAIYQRRQHSVNDVDFPFLKSCNHLVSYDISCAYWVNVVDWFQKHFPDLVSEIEHIRWLIPLVHVQNHKDNSMYCFASAYIPNAGHFHGETAEHYWAVSNQLGAQTRQMNNGHRQDTLIDHHSNWNWKKAAIMCA